MLPSTSKARTVVACLFSILFVGVADNQILSPLLPAIRGQFQKSSHEVAFLFMGYSFAAGLSVLFWGPLSDAFGRFRGLAIGLAIFACGSFTSCTAANFYVLMVGRIVTGMGGSMLSLNVLSYAADYFPYEIRGWAMGSIVSSYFAALILGVPIGSWIGDNFGWRMVFGMATIAGILLLGAICVALPRPVSRVSRPLRMQEEIRTYTHFFGRSRMIGALISSFFASAGTTGFLSFLGVWLHDVSHISGKKVGLVFLIGGAGALIASPFAGSLSDRIGKRVQFVVSNLCLAFLLLVLPGLTWGRALFSICALISIAAAFRQGPMEALLTEVAPAGSRGSFIALKNSFSQLGIGLTAAISGFLFESSGYYAVCWLCAFANLAAASGMAFFVKGRNL
jgi:predicted MFS family arabinose efflux permease